MLVNLIDISATRKAVEMVFPAQDVDAAIQGALAEMAPRVKMPGFRPGKAPRGMLMSKLRNEIVKDAAEKLAGAHIDEALQAIGAQPISRPGLAGAELTEGSGGTVKVQFDVAPEVALPDYGDLKLTKRKRAVDDALVERSIEEMRQKAARMVPVEGGAEIGHFVAFDLKYKPQGMKAKTARDRRLRLEAGSPFDAELVGMKVDEVKKFSLTVPGDNEDRQVAGKLVHHEVSVLDVRAKVVPELNDEFAKDTGRYDSLAALREGVRRELEESYENEATSRLHGDLLDRLLDAAPFEVPLSMVHLQLDDYCRELADRFAQMGLGTGKIDWQAYRRRRLNDAQRAVRSGYLLQALGNADDIQVSDEEIEGEIRKWMAESGATDTFEAVKADFDKHGATMEIRGRIRTEKIFNAVLKRVAVTEETLDGPAYEELLEMERRRAEGLAQARFDAGGLEDGADGLDEQDGGSPAAVVPAKRPAEPQEAPPATQVAGDAGDTAAGPGGESETTAPVAGPRAAGEPGAESETTVPVARPGAKTGAKAAKEKGAESETTMPVARPTAKPAAKGAAKKPAAPKEEQAK